MVNSVQYTQDYVMVMTSTAFGRLGHHTPFTALILTVTPERGPVLLVKYNKSLASLGQLNIPRLSATSYLLSSYHNSVLASDSSAPPTSLPSLAVGSSSYSCIATHLSNRSSNCRATILENDVQTTR